MSRTKPWSTSVQRAVFAEELAERFGARCFYCREPFVDLSDATMDHYLPRSLRLVVGYPVIKDRGNFVLACEPCNVRKGDTLPLPLVWLLLASAKQNPDLYETAA